MGNQINGGKEGRVSIVIGNAVGTNVCAPARARVFAPIVHTGEGVGGGPGGGCW